MGEKLTMAAPLLAAPNTQRPKKLRHLNQHPQIKISWYPDIQQSLMVSVQVYWKTTKRQCHNFAMSAILSETRPTQLAIVNQKNIATSCVMQHRRSTYPSVIRWQKNGVVLTTEHLNLSSYMVCILITRMTWRFVVYRLLKKASRCRLRHPHTHIYIIYTPLYMHTIYLGIRVYVSFYISFLW